MMPIWFDKHTALFDGRIPSLDWIKKQAKKHNEWIERKAPGQPKYAVTKPSVRNGVFDFLASGSEETLHVVAESVESNHDANRFITLLQQLVDAQPTSEGKTAVEKHLHETAYVVQVLVSGDQESDWEFDLLTFIGEVGFFADTREQELVFYGFGWDDFMKFKSERFFRSGSSAD